MTTREGEENVATLYGDIHYFYSGAQVKPRHHRFDKGSYVYLFENANNRRCRVEIANHPGTEDQDAFDGFLDQTHVRYSYRQHCLVSLTVAENVRNDEWHLPTWDPHNQNKYHYKLDSLDIYFWTQQDALQFISGVRRVLPPSHIEVLDEPLSLQPGGPMSAIVRNLENVAISDPQYSEHQASAAPVTQNGTPAPCNASNGLSIDNLPPPPPFPQHLQQQQQQQQRQQPQPQPQPQHEQQVQQPPAAFVPMAYNPAAPVAPETLRHREKTPPPDEDPLNPLAVAVAHDYQGQPFTPAYPHAHFPSGLPPGVPPSMTSPRMAPPLFAGPSQHLGSQRAPEMSAQAGLASPGSNGMLGAHMPGPPSFAPPPIVASPPPSTQAQSMPPPAVGMTAPPLLPLGGFSNYSYSSPTPAQQQGNLGYSVHQQIYRPTEAEMATQHQHQRHQQHQNHQQQQQQQLYQPKKENRGRFEENAGKLERGVSGMLKKFERKFG